MPKTLSRIALVLCCALLLACGGTGTQQATPTAVDAPAPSIIIPLGQPVIIGISAPLSGDQATLGNDIADAAELAIASRGGTLLGHPLKIERMDDHCTDAEKAVDVARQLVEMETLAGVVGPMCTIGAQAANKVYEAAHVVHISPSVTRIDVSGQDEQYFFRTAWRDDTQATVQAGYAANTLKAGKVTLVDDGEPYGKTLADAFARAFGGLGGSIVSRERVERGAIDFSPLARQVKSAAPEAVVFEGLNPEGALLLKALREAGYAGAFIAPDGLLSVRDFVIPGRPATEGAIVTGGALPDEAFVNLFRERFQRMPATAFVLQAYDAVSTLLAAIESTADEAYDGALVINKAALADALRQQHFAGLTGPIEFDEHGDRRGDAPGPYGLVVYRVTGDRFEPVR